MKKAASFACRRGPFPPVANGAYNPFMHVYWQPPDCHDLLAKGQESDCFMIFTDQEDDRFVRTRIIADLGTMFCNVTERKVSENHKNVSIRCRGYSLGIIGEHPARPRVSVRGPAEFWHIGRPAPGSSLKRYPRAVV